MKRKEAPKPKDSGQISVTVPSELNSLRFRAISDLAHAMTAIAQALHAPATSLHVNASTISVGEGCGIQVGPEDEKKQTSNITLQA